MSRPFLTIVTRHYYKRPELFKRCVQSLSSQTDTDFQHLVLTDNVGLGVAGANQLFYKNKDLVLGRYVFMLDDDNILTSDTFVADMKKEVSRFSNPGIIFIRMLINDSLFPTNEVWRKDRLIRCHIDTACFIMRSDLWKEHIHRFAPIKTTGDFEFINAVFNTRPSIAWVDKVYSRTQVVSKGAPEPESLSPSGDAESLSPSGEAERLSPSGDAELDRSITGITVVYNTKEIFHSAVTSVRRFHPNMPLVIVDGSEPGTPCYEYTSSLVDSNTRVFHAKGNIGHGRGLHLAIQYAQTPYLLVFDSDIRMKKSPVKDMLKLFEDDTWGVGYIEPTDMGGFEWGSRKHRMDVGPMRYLHPYFCLVQKKEYLKYRPFCHHGAPAVNCMVDIYNKGLSDKVLKEFPGLGHSGGTGWTWEASSKEYIEHRTRGTRNTNKSNNRDEIEGTWDPVIPARTDVIKFSPRTEWNESTKVTCITCTGDRPICLDLLQQWLSCQTMKPFQWIVVDDGFRPYRPSMECDYIRRSRSDDDPRHTLNINMLEALLHVEGDVILFCEDDEYYSPRYIETMARAIQDYDAVGICLSKYYHVGRPSYFTHPNRERASLAQTGVRKSFLPILRDLIPGDPFIDGRIWAHVNPSKQPHAPDGSAGSGILIEDGDEDCLYVGMKGMPGRKGIGAGHNGVGKHDPDMLVLRRWIKDKFHFAEYQKIHQLFAVSQPNNIYMPPAFALPRRPKSEEFQEVVRIRDKNLMNVQKEIEWRMSRRVDRRGRGRVNRSV